MTRIILITFLSTLFSTLLVAQPLNRATPAMMLKTAEEQVDKQDPYRALEWYEKYYEETKDTDIFPQLARLNMELRDYKKAERYYGRYLKEREGSSRKKKKELTAEQLEDRFNYGRSLKFNENYEDAIVQLEKYIETSKNTERIELAENEIAGAKLAMQQNVTLDDGKEVAGLKIENLKKLNSKEAEYGPFLHEGDLYYASFGDVEEVISTNGETEMAYAQIYKASKKKDKWEAGEPLNNKINREDFQTTHPHVSPDGQFLYFTRSLMRGNKVEISNIYYSEKKGSDWAAPNEVAIGFEDQEFRAYHPSVGDLFGKEVLFFVSDMDGGVGGKDIYYVTKKGDGVYGEPVNIASINTPGDDVTPFYRNGTLYFSSNGLAGYGGYDLFTTVWDGTRWSKPENMGKGYNTPLDEKSFFLDEDGRNGFFTSNRSGRGIVSKTSCFDIYSIEIPPITANVLAEVFVGKRALKGATVALVEMVNDQATNPSEQTNKKANNFDFPLGLEKTYMLIASRDGYSSDTAMVTTLDLKETTTFNERFQLEKLKPVPEPEPAPEEPEYEEIVVEINQPIRLSNIYYDFDDDKILEDAEKDLSVLLDLMNRYPDMVIELSSHTDARGNDAYNENLSQRRADSATKWLVDKGVAAERIKSVGYGEKQPATVDTATVAENPFLKEDWVLTYDLISKLSPKANREAAHQINRRTEFRIIEGPTNIKIKKMEKRVKKKPKVIVKPAPKKKTTRKKRSRKRNANPIGDVIDHVEGPRMVFDYTEIDFGLMKKGEQRSHIFNFMNEGDETLKIEFVSACECTTLEYSTEPVKPGEGGSIKAVFDSSKIEESAKLDIDIILENVDPATGYQIIERVSYTFQLEQ